jgi:hypothetical protein
VSRPKFKHLTVNQVYQPLARSNGKVYELTQAQRATHGKRHDKLHQFLSEIGVKALRQHLGQLLGAARIAKDREEYEGYFHRLFGQQPGLFDLEGSYRAQRAFAAFCAMALRLAGVSASALALPPLGPPSFPSATAAGFFGFSGGSGEPSSFSPMACSTTFRAIVAKS